MSEIRIVEFSTLSDARIVDHIKQGNIVIDPLRTENIGTSSVDVTLGRYFFREQQPLAGQTIYSPYDEDDVRRVWGNYLNAQPAGEYSTQMGFRLPKGIFPEDLVIWISPGETILAHTEEFIGGRNGITTMMKARSSLGRNFIEVCKCAGWGDVGYISRWTMEITNNSRHYTIPLVVGRRVAQIVFFETGPTLKDRDYADNGKYQASKDLEEIKGNWTPDSMLPKLWKDRELKKWPVLK
jgi:dCTP deaminase